MSYQHNFELITVDAYLKKYPQYEKDRKRMGEIVDLPDRACHHCGQFNVWKCVMVEMPDNDMCFTCITGESDASEDYELTL